MFGVMAKTCRICSVNGYRVLKFPGIFIDEKRWNIYTCWLMSFDTLHQLWSAFDVTSYEVIQKLYDVIHL